MGYILFHGYFFIYFILFEFLKSMNDYFIFIVFIKFELVLLFLSESLAFNHPFSYFSIYRKIKEISFYIS